MNSRKKRYAFVLPRFGEDIIGGAETLAGNLAAKVMAAGADVEIFTTCAKDNRTWKNAYCPGDDTAFGLPVHRFRVSDRDLESWIPKQIRIAEGMRLSVDEQLDWMEEGVNSVELYQELILRAADFDAIFFAPYLFATTFWGSMIAPDKSYLIPCLHDECYAYLEIIASMMGQVRGLLFNSPPEEKLARTLYGSLRGGSVGMGFEQIAPAELSAIKPYFKEAFPYLLYVGRKETGKNVQVLIDYFVSLKERAADCSELKLVVVGGGDFSDLGRENFKGRSDIVDLQHLSEEEKASVIKHALLLVQPSQNESFSIVLMEAWRMRVPVLVDGRCAVTRYHVEQSGGGLYYESEQEFSEVIRYLLSESSIRNELGRAGESYVSTKYSWSAVIERFNKVMEQISNVP